MDKQSIRQTFPRKLAYYMALHGKKRSDLVRDLGFKYTTIRDWEKGITIPRMDKVEMLAQYFACSNADLIEEKEKEPTVQNDGLTDDQRMLIEFSRSVPKDKAALLLRVMKSVLEGDE